MQNSSPPDEVLLRVARDDIPRLEHAGLMMRSVDAESSMLLRRAADLVKRLVERIVELKETKVKNEALSLPSPGRDVRPGRALVLEPEVARGGVSVTGFMPDIALVGIGFPASEALDLVGALAALRGRRRCSGAEAVGGEARYVEPCAAGCALHGMRDVLRAQAAPEVAVAVDGAEERAVLSPGGVEPGFQGANRAGCGARAARYGDLRARADLIGFRAADGEGRALLDEVHVVEVERHEFAAAERSGESEEKNAGIALAEE
jgi:hypothetical protein